MANSETISASVVRVVGLGLDEVLMVAVVLLLVLLMLLLPPALRSSLHRLHSALCAGQCAQIHAGPQKNNLRQRAHFLSPAPLQPGLAQ
jgi:hypothetical protein